MSGNDATTRAIRTDDGTVLVEQGDGSLRVVEYQTDWARIDQMSDADIDAASVGEDDAPELVVDMWERARPIYLRSNLG